MKLLENIHAVRMLGKFQNYLLTIAANTCNNYFKKAKPIYTDLNTLDITDDTRSALERMIENENTAEVRKALLSLPDYQKEVIILRFYHKQLPLQRMKIRLFLRFMFIGIRQLFWNT